MARYQLFIHTYIHTYIQERIRHQEPRDLDEACRIAQRFEVIHNAVQASSADQRAHRARQVSDICDETENHQRGGNDGRQERSTRYDNRKRWTDNRSTKVRKQQEAAASQPTQASAEQLELMKDLVKQCAEKDRVIDESRKAEKQWQQEKEELQRALGRKECLEAARNLVPSDMTPPAGQQANPPPRQRAPPPPRRNDGGCFNCGQPDHWARSCPQNDRRQRDARPPRDQ